jgi:hypothetical protein
MPSEGCESLVTPMMEKRMRRCGRKVRGEVAGKRLCADHYWKAQQRRRAAAEREERP